MKNAAETARFLGGLSFVSDDDLEHDDSREAAAVSGAVDGSLRDTVVTDGGHDGVTETCDVDVSDGGFMAANTADDDK